MVGRRHASDKWNSPAMLGFLNRVMAMRTSGVSDDDVPMVLPSLRELPPLDRDEAIGPFGDRPSSALLESDDDASSYDERDAVEGLPIDAIIDDIEEGSALDDAEGIADLASDEIDEAPDREALGDDADGLGDDASDLDESLLLAERGDDGADGLETDLIDMADPTEPLDGAGADDGGEIEPIVLPTLPGLDP
jgi:hypothetical protein